ncbi:ribosome hibernation-promoting factor, HPF/YfiA family [Labilibaculum sp.]|uniref:ribosome hibernation-promoting factor, HPF/YfiA family n=1 Tax=Labilibaculum sp. TaxID=2060723 RepID=UPI003562648D
MVKIQSIGFVAKDELEAFIQSKLNKLLKLDDDVVGVDVILRLEKSTTMENKLVEIILDLKGGDLFAKKQSQSFEESTDMVIEALRRQLVKRKEKLRAK